MMRAGKALGMIDGQPLGKENLSASLILGGAARACWQRAQLGLGYKLSTPKPGEQPVLEWHERFKHATPDTFGAEWWGDIVTIGSEAPMNDATRKQKRR